MPVVKANGINLHTVVLGDRGPLLIMIHGLVAGSVATWYFQFAASLAGRYRVILYDLRGHGQSEKTLNGYDVPTMAEDLAALIAFYQTQFDVSAEPVHLVGHSYGALVALWYGLHCDRLAAPLVESMIIVDAPLPASKYIAPGMTAITTDEAVASVASNMMESLSIAGGRKQRNFIERLQFLYLKSTMPDDISLSRDIPDAELQAMPAKTLLIYGDSSDCIAAGHRLHRCLPNNALITLGCGHYITHEQPEVLRREINRFFGVNT